MECTQLILGDIFEEEDADRGLGRFKIGVLSINGVTHDIYNGENIIGRDDLADICISSGAISLRHAVIEVQDMNSHLLYDCGSTNKTRIGKMTLKPNVRYNLFGGEEIMFANIKATYSKLNHPLIPQPTNDDSSSEAGSESMLNADLMDFRPVLNEDGNRFEEDGSSVQKTEETFHKNNNDMSNDVSTFNDSSVFIERKIGLTSTENSKVVDATVDDDTTDEEEDFVQPSQTVKVSKNNKTESNVQGSKTPNSILTEDIFHIEPIKNHPNRKGLNKKLSTDIFEMETQENTVSNKEVNYNIADIEENSQFIFNVEMRNPAKGSSNHQLFKDPTFEAETQVEEDQASSDTILNKSNICPENHCNELNKSELPVSGTNKTTSNRLNDDGCNVQNEESYNSPQDYVLCDAPTQLAVFVEEKVTEIKVEKDKTNCDVELMLTTTIINNFENAANMSSDKSSGNKNSNIILETNRKKNAINADDSFGLFEQECDLEMSELLISNSVESSISKPCQSNSSNELQPNSEGSALQGIESQFTQQNKLSPRNYSNSNLASENKSNASASGNQVCVKSPVCNSYDKVNAVKSKHNDVDLNKEINIEDGLDENCGYNDLTQANEHLSKTLDKSDIVSEQISLNEMNASIDKTQPNQNIPNECNNDISEAETQPSVAIFESCEENTRTSCTREDKRCSRRHKSKQNVMHEKNYKNIKTQPNQNIPNECNNDVSEAETQPSVAIFESCEENTRSTCTREDKRCSSGKKSKQNVMHEKNYENTTSVAISSFDKDNIEDRIGRKVGKLKTNDKNEKDITTEKKSLIDISKFKTQSHPLVENSGSVNDIEFAVDTERRHNPPNKNCKLLLSDRDKKYNYLKIIEADTQPYGKCFLNEQDGDIESSNLVNNEGNPPNFNQHNELETSDSLSSVTVSDDGFKKDNLTVEQNPIKTINESKKLSKKISKLLSLKNKEDNLDIIEIDTQPYMVCCKEGKTDDIESEKMRNPSDAEKLNTVTFDSVSHGIINSVKRSLPTEEKIGNNSQQIETLFENRIEPNNLSDIIKIENQISKKVYTKIQDEIHNHQGELSHTSTVKVADMEICSTVGTGIHVSTLTNNQNSVKKSDNTDKKDLTTSQLTFLNEPCSSSTPLTVSHKTESSNEEVLKKTLDKTFMEFNESIPILPSNEEFLLLFDKTPEKLSTSVNKKKPITFCDERTLVLGRSPRKRKVSGKMIDFLDSEKVASGHAGNEAKLSESKIKKNELSSERKEEYDIGVSGYKNERIKSKAVKLKKSQRTVSKKPHLDINLINNVQIQQRSVGGFDEVMSILDKEGSSPNNLVIVNGAEDSSLVKSESLESSSIIISKSGQDNFKSNKGNMSPIKLQKVKYKEMLNGNEKEELNQGEPLVKTRRSKSKPSIIKNTKENCNELVTKECDNKKLNLQDSGHINIQDKEPSNKSSRKRNKAMEEKSLDESNDIDRRFAKKIGTKINYNERAPEQPSRKSRRTTKNPTTEVDLINIDRTNSKCTSGKFKKGQEIFEVGSKKVHLEKCNDLKEFKGASLKNEGPKKIIPQLKSVVHENNSNSGDQTESKRITRKLARKLDNNSKLELTTASDIKCKSEKVPDKAKGSFTTQITSVENNDSPQNDSSKFGKAPELTTRVNKKDKRKNNLPKNGGENKTSSRDRSRSSSSKTDLSSSSRSSSISSLTLLISGSSMSNTPRRSIKKKEMVLFTGLSNPALESDITKLGGEIVDCVNRCTVLVTDKVRRTVKFLCALGQGKPIVTPAWITISRQCLHFEDPMRHLLLDPEAEQKFNFKLSQTIQQARNQLLLVGYNFHATPSVKPPPADIQGIVESCGGSYVAVVPPRWPAKSVIISHPDDRALWRSLKVKGTTPPLVTVEALLLGVLQYKFDIDSHRIN